MKTNLQFISAWLTSKVKSDKGASLVEYALLVALIAVVCVAAASLLGGGISTKLSKTATALG